METWQLLICSVAYSITALRWVWFTLQDRSSRCRTRPRWWQLLVIIFGCQVYCDVLRLNHHSSGGSNKSGSSCQVFLAGPSLVYSSNALSSSSTYLHVYSMPLFVYSLCLPIVGVTWATEKHSSMRLVPLSFIFRC